MSSVSPVAEFLRTLGARLRMARLGRDDTVAVFAERLGVSERTVRAMERGLPTVQIGTWIEALWVLDRLDEMRDVLSPRESLIERARATRPRRQRASRRPR